MSPGKEKSAMFIEWGEKRGVAGVSPGRKKGGCGGVPREKKGVVVPGLEVVRVDRGEGRGCVKKLKYF